MNDSKPKVSVVVCTYNRANILEICLNSLANQTVASDFYEVLVIDNNSTDNTKDVTHKFIEQNSNFKYFLESKQGLSYARNRGWQEALGEYVAYTDDDCKLPEQWLAVAKKIIEEISPGVFGGPSLPFYISPKPAWFKDRYASNVLLDEKARPLKENEYVFGMNIFVQRSLLEQLSGFDSNLGMSGKAIAYGEETDLIIRIRSTMPDKLIYFDPNLYVHHLVRPEKMTMKWVIKQRFADGKYAYRVFQGNKPVTLRRRSIVKQVLFAILDLSKDIVRGIFKRDRNQYPYLENYFYEHSFQHVRRLGNLHEQFVRASNKLKSKKTEK